MTAQPVDWTVEVDVVLLDPASGPGPSDGVQGDLLFEVIFHHGSVELRASSVQPAAEAVRRRQGGCFPEATAYAESAFWLLSEFLALN